MIRRISGTVVANDIQSIVVDVQGVGYLVNTSQPGIDFSIGQTATLHTYLAVRETALDLYGFQTDDELKVFELLIELPKIGPKSAAHILSQADITLLKEAVRNEDPSYLSKMSGIGKKSAEKIVAGLKEKWDDLGDYDNGDNQAPEGDNVADSIDALVTLGYPEKAARNAVRLVREADTSLTDANETIKAALRQLSS